MPTLSGDVLLLLQGKEKYDKAKDRILIELIELNRNTSDIKERKTTSMNFVCESLRGAAAAEMSIAVVRSSQNYQHHISV